MTITPEGPGSASTELRLSRVSRPGLCQHFRGFQWRRDWRAFRRRKVREVHVVWNCNVSELEEQGLSLDLEQKAQGRAAFYLVPGGMGADGTPQRLTPKTPWVVDMWPEAREGGPPRTRRVIAAAGATGRSAGRPPCVGARRYLANVHFSGRGPKSRATFSVLVVSNSDGSVPGRCWYQKRGLSERLIDHLRRGRENARQGYPAQLTMADIEELVTGAEPLNPDWLVSDEAILGELGQSGAGWLWGMVFEFADIGVTCKEALVVVALLPKTWPVYVLTPPLGLLAGSVVFGCVAGIWGVVEGFLRLIRYRSAGEAVNRQYQWEPKVSADETAMLKAIPLGPPFAPGAHKRLVDAVQSVNRQQGPQTGPPDCDHPAEPGEDGQSPLMQFLQRAAVDRPLSR